jgi:HD superfamily phosphohydrolase YqeK
MEITKTYLEEKMKSFLEEYKKVTQIVNEQTVLMHKYAGAIEATQLLISDIDNNTT